MTGEQQTILVVDDEEEIRENLCDFVEFQGFNVLQAAHGLQALEIIAREQPDLILSDLMMPEMGGMQLLQELPARNIDIPVVIMTAFGTMEYAIEAMKSGAADFLTKPIDLHYMMQVIGKVLERSAMRKKILEQQMQLDKDLSLAATIQQCLLPEPVDNPYLSVTYRYDPLIAIGGDHLTLHLFSDQEIVLALYDVSGHGVSAALTASLVHNQLQSRMAERRLTSNIVDLLNQFITRQIEKTSMFITLAIVMIDRIKETLTVTNAGHPDLYLWKENDQKLISISSHTPPIGMTHNILGNQNESTFEISSGDRMILYTDGFLEAMNPQEEMLGKAGLMDMIHKNIACDSDTFLQSMYDDLAQYRQDEPDDDLTFVLIDIK